MKFYEFCIIIFYLAVNIKKFPCEVASRETKINPTLWEQLNTAERNAICCSKHMRCCRKSPDPPKVAIKAVLAHCPNIKCEDSIVSRNMKQPISSQRELDIRHFQGFDKDEPLKLSEVTNCQRKLLITMKIQNRGPTNTKNEFIVVDHVYDPTLQRNARLLNPYVIKVRQSKVSQMYKLKFQHVVNSEATEVIYNKHDGNYTGCDTTSRNPTCGVFKYHGKSIPYSTGFCCSCDALKNNRRQPESLRPNKNIMFYSDPEFLLDGVECPRHLHGMNTQTSCKCNNNNKNNDNNNDNTNDNNNNNNKAAPPEADQESVKQQVQAKYAKKHRAADEETEAVHQKQVNNKHQDSPSKIHPKKAQNQNEITLTDAEFQHLKRIYDALERMLAKERSEKLNAQQQQNQKDQDVITVGKAGILKKVNLLPLHNSASKEINYNLEKSAYEDGSKKTFRDNLLKTSSKSYDKHNYVEIQNDETPMRFQPDDDENGFMNNDYNNNEVIQLPHKEVVPVEYNVPNLEGFKEGPLTDKEIENFRNIWISNKDHQLTTPVEFKRNSEALRRFEEVELPNKNRPVVHNSDFSSDNKHTYDVGVEQHYKNLLLRADANIPTERHDKSSTSYVFSDRDLKHFKSIFDNLLFSSLKNGFQIKNDQPPTAQTKSPTEDSYHNNKHTYVIGDEKPHMHFLYHDEDNAQAEHTKKLEPLLLSETDVRNLRKLLDSMMNSTSGVVLTTEHKVDTEKTDFTTTDAINQMVLADSDNPPTDEDTNEQLNFNPKSFNPVQFDWNRFSTPVNLQEGPSTSNDIRQETESEVVILGTVESNNKLNQGRISNEKESFVSATKKYYKNGRTNTPQPVKSRNSHEDSDNLRHVWQNFRPYAYTNNDNTSDGMQKVADVFTMGEFGDTILPASLGLKKYAEALKNNENENNALLAEDIYKVDTKRQRRKRQVTSSGTQIRGGQNCADRYTPPHRDPESYQESTHCLRFSELWYNVYSLNEPILDHSLFIQIFEKHEDEDGHARWRDITKGKMVHVGPFSTHFMDEGRTVSIRYHQKTCKVDLQSFAINYKNARLLIPEGIKSPKVCKFPEARGGPSEYLVVHPDQISTDGDQCDIAGVGFEAFVKQPNRCSVPKGTCLANQPKSLWMHDYLAEKLHKKGCFFLKHYGNLSETPIRTNPHGGDQYLALEYSGPYGSVLEMEVKADFNTILRPTSNAKITEVYVDSTSPSKTHLIIKVTNSGLISSSFSTALTDCPLDMPAAFNNIKSKPAMISPQTQHVFSLEICYALPADRFHCSVEVINCKGELVALRRIRIQKFDRCICTWHCLCACVGSAEGLKCNPMSLEHYHAAGFQGSLPIATSLVQYTFVDDIVSWMFYFGIFLTLTLLILGLTKGIIGIFCCVSVGMWGLDTLLDLPKKMNNYFEREIRNRPVQYDEDGWPIHPDTRHKVRNISKPTEFCMNLLFFFTYPATIFGMIIRKLCFPYYLYEESKTAPMTYKEWRHIRRTRKYNISEPSGASRISFNECECDEEEDETIPSSKDDTDERFPVD